MVRVDWVPPEGVDPSEILREAIAHRKKGEYEAALEKHIWLHDHALEIDSAYSGVRLSYNLMEWASLGKKHPSSKAALIEQSEVAKATVKNGVGPAFNAFHDFSSICSYLEIPEGPVALFEWLDINAPEKATKVFSLAFPDLLEAREYSLIGKYLDVPKRGQQIRKLFEINMQHAEAPELGNDMVEFAEQGYTYSIGALVAVLVNLDRKPEAEKISKESVGKVNNELYITTIEKALLGQPPEKWP